MSEWISTRDKMPTRNGDYLAVTEGLGFYRGCAVIKILYFYNGCFKLGDKDVYSVDVTHWMPLPKMPEKPYQEWDRISKERRNGGSDAKWSIEWGDSIREHEAVTFKRVRDVVSTFEVYACSNCERYVRVTYVCRGKSMDFNYCPYCGRPVVESEDDAE